ncbi:hypothetical protein BZG36_02468 [Bifiguratus adelaidae]|uniref:Cytochrome P450 n=1 Tax=Bifiguratus adelaidae TaxID=1938954 RepID=A0A261Y0V9_9FUNG|nr:hypothetical protein BZG36_02468 [Bifiguratus adelaidae]
MASQFTTTMNMVASKLLQLDLTSNAWAHQLLPRLQSRRGAVCGVLGAVVIYQLLSVLLAAPGQFKAINRGKEFALILTGVSGPERRRKEVIPLLAKGEPAYFSSERGVYTLYVAEPKMARTILMRTGTFPHDMLGAMPKGSIFDKLVGTPSIVNSNGHIWKTHRKIASPAFRKSMPLQLFGKATLELFEEFKKANYKVDSSDYMERFTLDVIGRAAFDMTLNVMMTVFNAINLATAKFDPLLYRLSAKRRQAHADLDTFLSTIDDVIAKKRATLSSDIARSDEEDAEKDLLTMILEANNDEGDDGQKLTDEEVKSNIITFFVAGHETTSNALNFAMYHLSQNPTWSKLHPTGRIFKTKQEQKMTIAIMGDEPRDIIPTNEQLQKLRYINQNIQEVLRLDPSALATTSRETLEDTEVGGRVITKGTKVTLDVWSLHHNPCVWEDPERFNPDRFAPEGEFEKLDNFAYLPFSHGSRQCIGMNFSLAEQRVFLLMFLRKFEVKLAPNNIHKDGLIYNDKLLANGCDHMLIELKPRY